MKFPKFLIIGSLGLFLFIIVLAVFKPKEPKKNLEDLAVQEVVIEDVELTKTPTPIVKAPPKEQPKEKVLEASLPEKNDIHRFFTTDVTKFPIVETVSYTSRVPWLEGRSAWIADYASHYRTSRHFIARSLNRSADYFTQRVSPGDYFNVFSPEKNVEFHLLIDLSRCKMWFYYHDVSDESRVLVKTYDVGLGRKDAKKASGYLTPLGTYQLGEKVAIYKPGMLGYFQDQKVEMIQVFGTRWIPFDKAVSANTEPPKGYGIHGSPWSSDPKKGLIEDRTHIKKYDSDGCIRLSSQDMEELFAIIITKPTFVHIVKDFHEAKLPGVEKTL